MNPLNQPGVLLCEVCNADLPNFNSMSWHIKGKRHQKALEYWQKKEEQARLCVFVRGYPMGTSEQELWQYFAQFGRVTKVSIVKPKNLFAIIEFTNRDVVKYVLETPNHRLNSQNLIVKPREVEVPGKPGSNQYEHGYNKFQQGQDLGARGRGRGMFGVNMPGPSRGRGGGGMGMLAFGRAGYQDQVRPGPMRSPNEYWFDQPASQKKNVEEEIETYYHEELLEKLVRVKGVQNQLEWLCQNLQVTADEAQAKFTLCEKLQACLGRFFPGCTVNQFGSSVNGFGLTGCDMDIFLDLNTMHSRTWEVQPVKLPFVRDFKFLKEKEWGPLLPKDLERMGMADECKLISRILTDNMKEVLNVQVVPSAKCPVVRFKYSGADIKCDLSVNNKLALQNTKLLYLYSVLNSRVRLLVYAIRYWGKIKGVAGNSQASTKLSNYALTLMVLNFLQNVEPPVLPTVEKLSNLHGPSNRSKIEGWDCTFAMDWQIIPQSNNTQSAAELLSGFFSYWSAFNFCDNVLISRGAREIPFIEFFEKDNMVDGRVRAFKPAAVNIQDPFVLNHNLTLNVNDKMREKLNRELRIAAIKTSVWGNEGFSMSNPSGGGDLVHLLNSEVPDIIQQEDHEKKEQVDLSKTMPARRNGEYTFEISLKPQQMTSKILKQLQKGPNYRIEWCKKMSYFICRVLKEDLLLTIEELPDATAEVKVKLREEAEKKAAADKRNKEIRQRREEKKAKKRQEFEVKLEQKLKQMREKSGKTDEDSSDAEEEKIQAAERVLDDEEAIKRGKPIPEIKAFSGSHKPGATGPGKRARPISLMDIDFDSPKRFKGVRRFNIDSFIQFSDDDEEIIEYKPEAPELKYKRESTAEVNQQFFMRAWCMTWARRKKVKNYLVNQEGRLEEGFAMEKLISDTIWQNDGAPLSRPVVGFYCYIESFLEGNETNLSVSMECKEGDRDFNTFFQFTKIYLNKMIEKHFY